MDLKNPGLKLIPEKYGFGSVILLIYSFVLYIYISIFFVCFNILQASNFRRDDWQLLLLALLLMLLLCRSCSAFLTNPISSISPFEKFALLSIANSPALFAKFIAASFAIFSKILYHSVSFLILSYSPLFLRLDVLIQLNHLQFPFLSSSSFLILPNLPLFLRLDLLIQLNILLFPFLVSSSFPILSYLPLFLWQIW